MKKGMILCIALCTLLLLSACGQSDSASAVITPEPVLMGQPADPPEKEPDGSPQPTLKPDEQDGGMGPEEAASDLTNAADMGDPKGDGDETFFTQVRQYILSNGEKTPEGNELDWDPAFAEAVDYASRYEDYRKEGGKEQDVAAYARYLNDRAAPPANWKELFEKSLLANYQQVPEHYEDLGDELYQIYVIIDGAKVPFVTVNARTGWYHG